VITRILFLFAFFSSSLWALEIDKKLKVTVLGVSASKKTLLVNKGHEDGLTRDNHAKFSLSTGMIFRAVAIRVSPSRSVWSVYRFIEKEKIKEDKAYVLKISTPVKVTEDQTRYLGPLAAKKLKDDIIPKEIQPKSTESKSALMVKKEIEVKERVVWHHEGVDFTNVNDDGIKPLRHEDVSFKNLGFDIKKRRYDATIDFSNL
jgi:hypothetical protein